MPETFTDTQPRKGERAEHIRLLRDRYPTMPPSIIAGKVGCSPANVTDVLKRYAKATSIEELRDFQANQGDIFDVLAHRTLASITDEDISKAPLVQRITGAAILIDKSRLVRGQPTSLHVHALMDVASMIREKRDAGQLARQVVTPPDASDLCDMQAGSDDE